MHTWASPPWLASELCSLCFSPLWFQKATSAWRCGALHAHRSSAHYACTVLRPCNRQGTAPAPLGPWNGDCGTVLVLSPCRNARDAQPTGVLDKRDPDPPICSLLATVDGHCAARLACCAWPRLCGRPPGQVQQGVLVIQKCKRLAVDQMRHWFSPGPMSFSC